MKGTVNPKLASTATAYALMSNLLVSIAFLQGQWNEGIMRGIYPDRDPGHI